MQRREDEAEQHHEPVLVEEVMAVLEPHPGEIWVDGTLGRGGHASRIAERIGPDGKLFGLDLDDAALEWVQRWQEDKVWGCKGEMVKCCYSQWGELLGTYGLDKVNGILLDLGVSSPQLAVAQRGFSFQREGPLSLRMDPEGELSAAELVATLTEGELVELLVKYGEERFAGRIARAIVRARSQLPITTTTDLAELVCSAVPSGARRQPIHPATRTFQALRIAVNQELDRLTAFLEKFLGWVAPGGRVGIIAYHSLEDRRVKWWFRYWAGKQVAVEGDGLPPMGDPPHEPLVKELTKKPVRPSATELNRNPRSRSARFRAVRKL